jgi:hypothetical protein
MIAFAVFGGVLAASLWFIFRSFKGIRGRFGPGRWKVEVKTVKVNGRSMYSYEHMVQVNIHKRGAFVTIGQVRVNDPDFEDTLIEFEDQATQRAAALNAMR